MSLINKYRPQTFDEVIGHGSQVAALEHAVKAGTARSFLFTGPSGLGKTTLARITARAMGVKDVIEIDAATNTGIEAMREVTSSLMYRGLGEGGLKAVIVDEAHDLSKQAKESLLKILEEPPEWVYWFLCTTEPTKIGATFRTRCLHIDLKPVAKKAITGLLDEVAIEEKLKLPKGVTALCAEESGGSPRQALSYLAACAAAKDLDEAYELIGTAAESAEAIDLARLLVKRAKWSEVQALLKLMKDLDPESVRRVVQAYLTTVILNSKSEDQAGGTMEILDAFSQPFYNQSGLVLACGKVLLS